MQQSMLLLSMEVFLVIRTHVTHISVTLSGQTTTAPNPD